MSKTAVIPVSQLISGQSAIVHGFGPGITSHCRKLLQSLGINREAIITLIRRAPFGDPLQLQILGSQFSVRESEANHIYVVKNY